MDIKPPPRRPQTQQLPTPSRPPVGRPSTQQPTPPLTNPSQKLSISNKKSRRVPMKWIIIGICGVIIAVIAAMLAWYFWAIQPLHPGSNEKIRIKIESGDTTSIIAQTLQASGVVKSANAVRVYAEISGTKSKLQAGGYTVSPGQSVPDIINHLVQGNTDQLSITISPGITLRGIRDSFKEHGYSDAEITAALNATYTSPLLADKPAGASLEGYIYPETFNVDPNDNLSTLLERSFNELYSRLQRDGILDKFKQRGLNIHQALTLASIIQKEESDPADQKQVAQVFLLRLSQDMALESDPTFKYAAQLLGVEPSITIDSPYNTRKYAGLPPGPIANMNYSALQAVADPVAGDYLYFVAGDDGKTYFSHTLEQHIQNVKNHCSDLCN